MLDFNREDPIYNGRIGVYVLLRDELCASRWVPRYKNYLECGWIRNFKL